MLSDSVNVEILRIKRQLAATQENDIDRIVADARSRQTNVVSQSPRQYNAEQTGQFDPQSVGVHGQACSSPAVSHFASKLP